MLESNNYFVEGIIDSLIFLDSNIMKVRNRKLFQVFKLINVGVIF